MFCGTSPNRWRGSSLSGRCERHCRSSGIRADVRAGELFNDFAARLLADGAGIDAHAGGDIGRRHGDDARIPAVRGQRQLGAADDCIAVRALLPGLVTLDRAGRGDCRDGLQMRMVVRIDRDDLTADGETAAIAAGGDSAALQGSRACSHAGRGNGRLFLKFMEAILRRALDKVEEDHVAVFQIVLAERETVAVVSDRFLTVDGVHPAGPGTVFRVAAAERDVVRVCDTGQIARIADIGILVIGQDFGHGVPRGLARVAHGFIACAGGIGEAVLRGERAVDADGHVDRGGPGRAGSARPSRP